MWSLTFMLDGKKVVEWIPKEWVEELRPLVEEGREFKSAVAEVFAVNAQLFRLWRKQQSQKKKAKPLKQPRQKRRS
jgi:transposase-like protein